MGPVCRGSPMALAFDPFLFPFPHFSINSFEQFSAPLTVFAIQLSSPFATRFTVVVSQPSFFAGIFAKFLIAEIALAPALVTDPPHIDAQACSMRNQYGFRVSPGRLFAVTFRTPR